MGQAKIFTAPPKESNTHSSSFIHIITERRLRVHHRNSNHPRPANPDHPTHARITQLGHPPAATTEIAIGNVKASATQNAICFVLIGLWFHDLKLVRSIRPLLLKSTFHRARVHHTHKGMQKIIYISST